MLNYKVEYDKSNQKFIIHWYDEEGNEVDPDEGTYRVTIPANTVEWVGDGVNCEGKEGNDEFIYTFKVSGKAPKPIITPHIKDHNIYFVVDNSAVNANYKTLGYKTYCTAPAMIGDNIVFNSPVKVDIVYYDPEMNVRKFGYDENKAVFIVNLGESLDVIPDFVYECTIIEDSVANAGLGDRYSKMKVYNDDTVAIFTGTTRPDVTFNSNSYDASTNKLTAVYNVLNADLQALIEDYTYVSDLDNRVKPYLINEAGTVTAYCSSIVISEDGKTVTCVYDIKNPEDFLGVTASKKPSHSSISVSSGMRSLKFTHIINEKWVINVGDGSRMIGLSGNEARSFNTSFPYLTSVPTPIATGFTQSSRQLVALWTNINGEDYMTTKMSPVTLTANMNDGTTVDISKFIVETVADKTTTVSIDVTTNFDLDTTEVKDYSLLFAGGYYQNDGDGMSTSGTAKSCEYKFSYGPVDCQPTVNYLKTNVNPFYPIIDGNKLAPEHDGELSFYEDDCLTIETTAGTRLMGWSDLCSFTQVDSASEDKWRKNETIEDNSLQAYSTDDDKLFSIKEMYSSNGAFENYHGNQIVIKAKPEKFGVVGDGITKLGQLSGDSDTVEIKKYVLELGLNSCKRDRLTASTEIGKYTSPVTVTDNTLGSIIDWNYTAFGSPEEAPKFAGGPDWGSYQTYPAGCVYQNGSISYSGEIFSNFWHVALHYFWAKKLYDQTDIEQLKNNLSSWISESSSEYQFVSTMKNRAHFEDWYYNIYFADKEITCTGTSESDKATPACYTYYPERYSQSEVEEMSNEYTEKWKKDFISQSISFYGSYAMPDNTYTFLYDKPAQCWKMGIMEVPYNGRSRACSIAITDLHKIDVSNQEDFSYFLANQGDLHTTNAELDLSKAKYCNYMFYNCYEYNNSQFGSSWNGKLNTSDSMDGVISACSMYEGCESITGIPSTFSFSNLLYADRMFQNCECLRQFGPKFNPSKLVSANWMLSTAKDFDGYGARFFDINDNYKGFLPFYHSLDQINSYHYYDTATKEVVTGKTDTTIEVYPEHAFAMTIIPSTWKSVSNIKTAIGMFMGRTYLSSIPEQWDFASLQDATEMFENCETITRLPSGWTTTTELTNGASMFNGCISLTGLTKTFDCKNLKIGRQMFGGCESLVKLTDSFQPNLIENTNAMFQNCISFTGIPTGWTTLENATQTKAMFDNCSSFTGLPASWTTCHTISTRLMFNGCKSMTSVNMEFTAIKEYANMFTESNITACTKPMNFGGVDSGTSSTDIFLSPKLYEFYIEDLGKTSNYINAKGVMSPFELALQNLDTPTTDEEKKTLAESIMYMCDHAYSGVSDINTASAPKYQSTQVDRGVASNSHYVISVNHELWTAIRPYLLAHYSEHSDLAQYILLPRLQAEEDAQYTPLLGYYISWTA